MVQLPNLEELVAELRKTAEEDYSREELVAQRRELQRFLRTQPGNFRTLRNSYGGPVDARQRLVSLIFEFKDRIHPLVPDTIRVSLDVLMSIASCWAHDGVRNLDMSKLIDLSDQHWKTLHTYEALLGEVVAAHVSPPEAPPQAAGKRTTMPLETFPTPAGATWQDVRIEFKDGHTVSVRLKDVGGVFNFTQMGMVNRRNGNPTKQWELLRTFARAGGILDWSNSEASWRNQKRREILAKDLRAFFRIEGDPLVVTDDRKGWRTRFRVSGDG